jgi:hypothetical protein
MPGATILCCVGDFDFERFAAFVFGAVVTERFSAFVFFVFTVVVFFLTGVFALDFGFALALGFFAIEKLPCVV